MVKQGLPTDVRVVWVKAFATGGQWSAKSYRSSTHSHPAQMRKVHINHVSRD
jgi:hypothetical protein